jgi:hypothetical protein
MRTLAAVKSLFSFCCRTRSHESRCELALRRW